MNFFAVCLFAPFVAAKTAPIWEKHDEGVAYKVISPLPSSYVSTEDLPAQFSWGNVNGTSYLTKNLNQHIPQYCGSCWAFAALSSLGDRIKIARKAAGIDINLSVQHILNCAVPAQYPQTCLGGSPAVAYEWIASQPDGIVFDTCNPYLACSHDSVEGFCPHVDTSCTPENVCRTCSTFSQSGGFCSAVAKYPNATVAEFGKVTGEDAIMKEVFARGPVACGVDAEQILSYHGGIASGVCNNSAPHLISVIGWGEMPTGEKYWLIRNSWGEFWGELGHFKVSRGTGNDLCVETAGCNWATPKTWTETNYPCDEDGGNCKVKEAGSGGGGGGGAQYIDPSVKGVPLGKEL